jgi:hypothetical protein
MYVERRLVSPRLVLMQDAIIENNKYSTELAAASCCTECM